MFLVFCPGAGYLKIPHTVGEPITLGDEFSIVDEPGNSMCLSRERAEEFAAAMNKRESTKRWEAISWAKAWNQWKAGQT